MPGRGGQEGGYSADIECSCLETWLTGSFLMSGMMIYYPEEHTLKISCWYLNWKCVRKGVSRRGVLGGCWGFLTRDMADRVIPDVMKDVLLPKVRYPENFMLISQWKVCQEGGVKKRGTWRTVRVPDRSHGWQDSSWFYEWCSVTLRNISWKFQINIFICCEVTRGLGVNGQPP